MSHPTTPACGQPATTRIEAYSPAEGRAHGTLDLAVYVCARHTDPFTVDVRTAGMTAHRQPLADPRKVGRPRCGDGFNYLTRVPINGEASRTTNPPPDEYAGHPIIERVAYELRSFGGNMDRAAAGRLLPHYEHYRTLTEREIAAILRRFPEATR